MQFLEMIFDFFCGGQSDTCFSGNNQMSLSDITSGIDLSNYSPEQLEKIMHEAVNSTFVDGDISFEGSYEVECRDKAASHLIDELKRHDVFVRSSDFYYEKDMGGLTSYTAKVVKEAINNARLHGNIDNKTFEDLMNQVKEACYCG